MAGGDGSGDAEKGRGRPSSSYTGSALSLDRLAATLSELARSLHEEGSVEHTLRGIVSAAVDTVPGTDEAGLSVIEVRRTIRTRAGTAGLVYQIDQAQYDTGEGLCLDAFTSITPCACPTWQPRPRWPRFTARVAALGVRSMLSFQLYVEHDNLGALNLYSRDTDAFTDESEEIGMLFATHAAVAMAHAEYAGGDRGQGERRFAQV
jgi:GAF domain-containing protein